MKTKNKTILMFSTGLFIILIFFSLSLILFSDFALAEDIDEVFGDVEEKSDQILSFFLGSFLKGIATIGFLAWVVGMMSKKISWQEGIPLIIVIILAGFTEEIIEALLNINL